MNLLSLVNLILAPFLAIFVIVSPFISSKPKRVKNFSLIFSGLHLLYSLCLLIFFAPQDSGFAYQTEFTIFGKSWLEPLGISFNFAVDSLSMSLVILSSLIFFLSIVISRNAICSKQKIYYAMMFLFESAILGIFCSRDMFAFFFFWMLALIPIYFLLSFWGEEKEGKNAMNFVIYSIVAGFFILFGTLCIYFSNLGTEIPLTGNIDLIDVGNSFYPQWFKYVMFACFFIGFGTKLPVVPFHNWLPNDIERAALPSTMLISGILLNIGVYGLIRFNLQLFPEIFEYFAPYLVLWGCINVIYATLRLIKETNLKRMGAYLAIFMTGTILTGLGSLSETGFQGAVFQMISLGIILTSFMFIIGVFYLRTKSCEIDKMAGIGTNFPKLSVFFKIAFFSTVCIPGLISFPGWLMSVMGLYISDLNPKLSLTVTAVIFFALLIISCIFVATFKKIFSKETKNIIIVEKLSQSEIFVLSVLVFLIVFFGIFPMILFNFFDTSLYLISSIWQV